MQTMSFILKFLTANMHLFGFVTHRPPSVILPVAFHRASAGTALVTKARIDIQVDMNLNSLVGCCNGKSPVAFTF